MLKALVIVLLISVCTVCRAQDSEQFRACNDHARTQSEMNQCAAGEAQHTEMQLNDTYTKLRTSLRRNRDAAGTLRLAELAWIRYRNAYIAAMYPVRDKQVAYGTIYPMEVALLRAQLTQSHIKDLLALKSKSSLDRTNIERTKEQPGASTPPIR